MSVWFDGEGQIACTLQRVKDELVNPGAHYTGVVQGMPGLSTVELVEAGPGFVTIQTNEGLMKRTNLVVQAEAERVVVEFDEVYEAGSMVTTKTHFRDEFMAIDGGVHHRTTLSAVEAPGVLGFFYRKFGSKNIGNAFLRAYKMHLEAAIPGDPSGG